MQNKEKFDFLADISKVVIDLLPIEEFTKMKRKLDIEAVSLVLKTIDSSAKELTPLCEAARRFNLDRVVIFPCMVYDDCQLFLRMYGGDIPAFCQCLGIMLIPESNVSVASSYIFEMEQKYGIVLYDRR